MTDEEKQPHEEKKAKERTRKKPRRSYGTGSVFERKGRKGKPWVAQIILENGETRQTYYKTKKEAEDALNELLYQQRHGTLATGPKQAVAQYLEYWLEIHRDTLKLSSYAVYRRHLDKHILPGLGRYELQSLTADQVQAFYAKKQKEGISARTLRIFHAILSAAFKDAVRWRRLTYNVCDAVKLPRLNQHERKPLDQEQAKRLLSVAKGSPLECLFILALVTGMRLGEMLALHWGNINFEEKTLQVHHTVSYIQGYGYRETDPKTESSRRTIALPQIALDALRQHHAIQLEARLKASSQWQEQGLIFTNLHGGYLGRTKVRVTFNKMLDQIGLPHMHFHDLRHSAATILLSMGINIKVVQEILGHAHISMTLNVYGHVLPSMQRDAMDEMDNLFGGWEREF